MRRAFSPRDFLDLATQISKAVATREELYVTNIEEAWIRTGISRAYYAAFLYVRRLLGLSRYKKADVHQRVIKRLKVEGGGYKYIGHRLSMLRSMRNKADYDLPPAYVSTLRDLERAVKLSTEIMNRARRLRWPPRSTGAL
ncbi:MAG: hypothetical protein DRJ67_11355 [Thermoprotei archaeon]|nr:MAG: hypothetical protein DRJ67_11355 [Thermoprotei archaeon]